MLLPVFHFTVLAVNLFTLWYDQVYVDFPFREEVKKHELPFKNRVLFLTMWCLALQTVYFAVALLNDFFGTNAQPKKRPLIRFIKDHLFSLAFPLAAYVFIAFWSIYAIDRELIFPEVLAKALPVWANHVMHTFIAPFIVLELLLSKRVYPSKASGVGLTLIFMVSYLVLLSTAYSKTGVWVYPVLDVLNWPLRIVFFAISIAFGLVMYVAGEKLNAMVNGSHKEVSAKSKNR